MGDIKLGKEFEAIIQNQITVGHYDNATDVIAAGLSLLEALGQGADGLSPKINEAFEDGSEDIPFDAAFDHIEMLYLQDTKARS